MGYFTQQIYQEPQSMYVDPRLDVLQQSAATIQGRHDKAVSEMNAYDILAANLQVTEGDQYYKDQKVAELQQASKAIADSGDYAMAQPRINMAAKGFLADQNLIAMQENRKAIDAYNLRRQELGASALDFNPADNWRTVGEDNKARRFVAHVEARKDWDKRAQEVTRMMANERPLALQQAGVDGYLRSGSISGISDADVRNYLSKSVDRFTKTEDGDQMYRKLTKIDGLSHDQAEAEIARFVYNVGSAQVHEKIQHQYQVNQPEMQARGFAHDATMQEDRQAHDISMENLRYKKAMDLAKEKDLADKKAAKEEPAFPSMAASILTKLSSPNPDGSIGGSMTQEEFGALNAGNVTKVNDSESGTSFDAVNITGPKLLTIGEVNPAVMYELSTPEGKKAKEYYTKVGTIDNKIATLKKQLEVHPQGRPTDLSWNDAMERFPSDFMGVFKNISDETGLTNGKSYSQLQKELATAEADRVALDKRYDYHNNKGRFEKFAQAAKASSNPTATKVSKALDNVIMPSIIDESSNNSMIVSDGTSPKAIVKVKGFIKGKELAKKFEDGVGLWESTSPELDYMIKNRMINMEEGEEFDPEKQYTITYNTVQDISDSRVAQADKVLYGNSSKYQESIREINADRVTKLNNANQTALMVSKLGTNEVDPRTNKKYSDIRQALIKDLETQAGIIDNPAQKGTYIKLANDLKNYNNLLNYEKYQVVRMLYELPSEQPTEQ